MLCVLLCVFSVCSIQLHSCHISINWVELSYCTFNHVVYTYIEVHASGRSMIYIKGTAVYSEIWKAGAWTGFVGGDSELPSSPAWSSQESGEWCKLQVFLALKFFSNMFHMYNFFTQNSLDIKGDIVPLAPRCIRHWHMPYMHVLCSDFCFFYCVYNDDSDIRCSYITCNIRCALRYCLLVVWIWYKYI